MRNHPVASDGVCAVTELDDDTLVSAAQEDTAAFAALYERYIGRIYRYLRARTRIEEDAADLTQQVFLRALDALPAYRPQGAPFAAWLFRIARNAATDAHRRHRDTAAWDGLPQAMQAAESGSPEEAALHTERLERLRDLLRDLDPGKRELLALRFAGGLSSREIALVVGKREAAVKRQLTRTIHDLKERYHA
jgi:RNA polymerase sigma-70 factor (ECF subfamily)